MAVGSGIGSRLFATDWQSAFHCGLAVRFLLPSGELRPDASLGYCQVAVVRALGDCQVVMVGCGTFFLVAMVCGGIFFLQVGNYYPSLCGAGAREQGAGSRGYFFKCLYIKGLHA